MTAACLRRRAAIRIAKAVLLAALAAMETALRTELLAIRIAGVARRPGTWTRYAKARLLHPVPGAPRDGGPLTPDEIRALAGIIDGRKRTAPEGARP